MIPSVARDHLEQKRSRPLPIIPRKCIIMYLSQLKKNNIKHFLNGPYIGNFMSLWGGLCFWVCVCVYICRGLGARRAPSPLQIIQIIQIGEIRNIYMPILHALYLLQRAGGPFGPPSPLEKSTVPSVTPNLLSRVISLQKQS